MKILSHNHFSSYITNRIIDFIPLSSRHKYNDIVFMYGIFDCLEFLLLIGFKVPAFNSNNILYFYVLPSKHNYLINSPLCRFPQLYNELINFDPVSELKSHVFNN